LTKPIYSYIMVTHKALSKNKSALKAPQKIRVGFKILNG